jgi:hypothetical protein
MQTNFLLGALRLAEPARLLLKRQPYDLIARHAINDHGHISEKERKMNETGMRTIGAIISRYRADPTNPHSKNVLIITSNNWAETLVTLE